MPPAGVEWAASGRAARGRGLRRLYVEQALGWTVAWLIGVATLFGVAVATHGRLSRRDLDAELGLTATAIYGLTWLEADGTFHAEMAAREPGLLDGPFDVWVIDPGEPVTTLLAPSEPRFRIQSLEAIAAGIVESEEDDLRDGLDALDRPFRLHGTVTYDDADRARAAILVAADPRPWRAAHSRFVRETALVVLALSAAGLLVGAALSRRALRPVLAAVEQQGRFLAAAAHELRTPVASLRAVCESAAAGGEAPGEALARVSRLVGQTGRLVEELLLLARLDSAAALGHRQPVRLDLLAEATLPEDGSVRLEAVESIVEADPALLETALRNLVENARIHGATAGGAAEVRVTVRNGEVAVEDDGPGFPRRGTNGESPDDLLKRGTEAFVAGPGSPGTGFGLAIVRLIAERHGGRLTLENRASGGARVTLSIGSGRFS